MTSDEQAFWDRAAVAAMQGFLICPVNQIKGGGKRDKGSIVLADVSSNVADALLAERRKRMEESK